jgi:hypothetical protein
MGLLKDLVKGIGEDKKVLKAKVKDAEQDRKVERILNEREKSSNERDLEKRMKQKREEQIKQKLDVLRKQDNKEMWKSKNSVLKSEHNIMTNDRPILKEKNIFKDTKHIFINKDRMIK